MKTLLAILLFLGVVSSTQIDHTAVLEKVLNEHITTCTACHIATGVIQDDAAVEHANKLLHGYCKEVPSKYEKICHGFADRIFQNALELGKHFTLETNCENFCGLNAKPLTIATLCEGVTVLLDNIESLMSILDMKVKTICSTEPDSESCFSHFQKWRPFISNFLKRSILRVVSELEPKSLCNIG
jgi:hypothetical protein